MLRRPFDDHYALLGVAPDADDAAIQRAWRLQGPVADDSPVAVAYAVLSDPLERLAYDLLRGVSPVEPALEPPTRIAGGPRRK